MMTVKASIFLTIFLFIHSIAFSHDVIQPDWRGLDGTTHQIWEFTTSGNPVLPDVDNNPYGDPTATITVGLLGEGWLETLGFGSQTGLWDLGDGGGQIVLDIPNRPEPLPYKEIRIQVTYFMDISQPPTIDVPGAAYVGGQTGVLIEDTGMGSGWYLDLSIWRIEPNPSSEKIYLYSSATWGTVIDQIVVDTICAPEPATICLLTIGGLFARGKRRR